MGDIHGTQPRGTDMRHSPGDSHGENHGVLSQGMATGYSPGSSHRELPGTQGGGCPQKLEKANWVLPGACRRRERAQPHPEHCPARLGENPLGATCPNSRGKGGRYCRSTLSILADSPPGLLAWSCYLHARGPGSQPQGLPAHPRGPVSRSQMRP